MSINVNLQELQQAESLPKQERLLEAALSYVRSGSLVMPLYPNTKMPALPSWGDASGDPAVIRGWFGPNGPHRDGNIAILIHGFKVIDIDRHGDVDGFATLKGALDGATCPRAVTPNNGEHLLVSSTTVKKAPGVEILADGHLFTVYPSEIDGKRYRWKTGGRPAPVTILAGVRDIGAAPSTGGAVALAPPGYVRRLLEHLDPDMDYATWLRVGMAIHHNDAGEVGIEVWEEWSQTGKKYKNGECAKRWATFDADRGKPTTLRWLVLEAMRNGMEMSREDLTYHAGFDNIQSILKMNDRYGLYDAGGTMYVVYKENGAINMADPYNFRVKTADQKVESDGKLKPLAEVWLEHPDRRIVTEVGMWVPGEEPEGALNSYDGFAVDPIPCEDGDIDMFLNFMRDDICSGNLKHYGFLLDMLAFKAQNPLALIKICLVMQGGEGVGKGALTRVMENIIGPKHAVNVSSVDNWLGKFAGSMLKGAIWLSANEAYWSGNHSQSERLKALITEETLDVEEKFVKARKQQNRLMVAITTNNDWAVPAGQDSRRFFVLKVSQNRAKDAEFWEEFHARTGVDRYHKPRDPEYLGKILWWLQHHKIVNKLDRAMETDALIEQRKESVVGSREEIFALWIQDTFCKGHAGDLVTGAGDQTFVRMERADGGDVIAAENVYKDYRAFVKSEVGAKLRMTYDQGKFNEKAALFGLVSTRVRKSRLKMGGRPLSGDYGLEDKIVVMSLPTAAEVESAILEHHSLFSQNNIKDEDE